MSDNFFFNDRQEQELGRDGDSLTSGGYGGSAHDESTVGLDQSTTSERDRAYNAGSDSDQLGRSYGDESNNERVKSQSYGVEDNSSELADNSNLTSSGNEYRQSSLGQSSLDDTERNTSSSYQDLDNDSSLSSRNEDKTSTYGSSSLGDGSFGTSDRNENKPSTYGSSSLGNDSFDRSDRTGATSHNDTSDSTDLPSYNKSNNDNTTTLLDSTTSTGTMSSSTSDDTRLGLSDTTTPYLGGHETYGSGTTGGPGHGNKTSSHDSEDLGAEATRLDSAHKTEPYMGGTSYGSGTTAGPGAGNKTSEHSGSSDSTMGKLMEKAGEMFKKDDLAQKGTEKRETAGYGGSE